MNIPRLIYLCFAIYFIWNFKQQQKQEVFLESVHQQDLMVAEVFDNVVEEMRERVSRELQEYSKREYRPILPAFAEIQTNFGQFYKQIDSLSEFQKSDVTTVSNYQLRDSLRQTVKEGYASYERLLLNHGKLPFGLKQEEIESRLENMQTYLETHLPKSDLKYTSSANLLSHLKSRAKLLEYHLLKEIVSYRGGRMIICRFGMPIEFPIITPKNVNPVIGESFEATISMGQYVEEIDPELVEYIVNGDTLITDPETGRTNFSIPAISHGTKQLDISYSIKNPLTGQLIKAKVPFRYRVLPK